MGIFSLQTYVSIYMKKIPIPMRFQSKRVPYLRQETYTKFSEGLINLGFDESADAEQAKRQKEEKAKESASKNLSAITESNNNNSDAPKRVAKVEKQEKEAEKKEESPKKCVSVFCFLMEWEFQMKLVTIAYKVFLLEWKFQMELVNFTYKILYLLNVLFPQSAMVMCHTTI